MYSCWMEITIEFHPDTELLWYTCLLPPKEEPQKTFEPILEAPFGKCNFKKLLSLQSNFSVMSRSHDVNIQEVSGCVLKRDVSESVSGFCPKLIVISRRQGGRGSHGVGAGREQSRHGMGTRGAPL